MDDDILKLSRPCGSENTFEGKEISVINIIPVRNIPCQKTYIQIPGCRKQWFQVTNYVHEMQQHMIIFYEYLMY